MILKTVSWTNTKLCKHFCKATLTYFGYQYRNLKTYWFRKTQQSELYSMLLKGDGQSLVCLNEVWSRPGQTLIKQSCSRPSNLTVGTLRKDDNFYFFFFKSHLHRTAFLTTKIRSVFSLSLSILFLHQADFVCGCVCICLRIASSDFLTRNSFRGWVLKPSSFYYFFYQKM